jgi:methionyl-tRNA formyltransferase
VTAGKLRTVALLAREPGLLVLRDALVGHPRLDLVAVFTHGKLPKAEGGDVRPEAARFAEMCAAKRIPLVLADQTEAKDFSGQLPSGDLDLMISLSWRYLVSQSILNRFRGGCINLHRGALPAYAGAKPVEKAIMAGEKRVAITAHEMTAEIDAGERIAEVWYDLPPCPTGRGAADHAEHVKTSIYPLYAPLARLAIEAKIANLAQKPYSVST